MAFDLLYYNQFALSIMIVVSEVLVMEHTNVDSKFNPFNLYRVRYCS